MMDSIDVSGYTGYKKKRSTVLTLNFNINITYKKLFWLLYICVYIYIVWSGCFVRVLATHQCNSTIIDLSHHFKCC